MKKEKSKVFKIFIIAFLAVVLCFIAVFLYFLIPSLGIKLDETKLSDEKINVALFDTENIKIANSNVFSAGEYIKSKDIPDFVKDSFVYIEDKRFYEHDGIDRHRMVGAIVENLKSMRFKEGASTITQQLIKNTHLSNEKNLTRKFAEIRLAQDLEKAYPKDKILEMYLNSVYFGNNVYGIVKASKYYFNKSVQELTLDESAMLAGIINAPNAYSPDKNLEKCIKRRNMVLKALLDNKKIDNNEYNSAISKNIDLSKIGLKSVDEKSYADMVISEASEVLGLTNSQIKHSDIKIYTYLNSDKQNALLKSLQQAEAKTAAKKNAQKMAIAVNNYTGGVEAFYANTESNPYYLSRQVGSVAKPLVTLAPSFEQKLITPSTMILDEPTNFGDYSPSNIGDKYNGWITVREAISKSKNIPAVKLLNALNKDKIKSSLYEMDLIKANDEINLNMALGIFESGLTIKQLTQGYMMLANGGEFKEAKFIKRIEDNQGRVLYEHKSKIKKIFEEDSAFLTTEILKDVVSVGTAKNFALNIPLAGKTGTVGKKNCPNNSDALFCSYTPQETAVFWVFSDYDDLLSSNITGSTIPVILAKNYYNAIYKNNDAQDFKMPKTVTKLKIDKVSLENTGKILIANSYLPKHEIIEEYFSVHNIPTKVTKRCMPKGKPKNVVNNDFFKDFFDTLIKHPLFGA